jgi:Fe-S oxidoreductase
MKICLIAPKVNFSTNIKELNEFWHEFQKEEPNRNIWSGVSTALLTIAALTPSENDIVFIDENYENIDFSQKYDLVGISSMTPNAMRAYTISDEFRNREIKVVLGGVHPTLLPDEAKEHCDAVVIGEAENVWKDVLEDTKNNILKSFYHSNKLANLNLSPIPRFDLLKADNYKYIWLQTSRGCPHDCEYCTASKIFGKGFRRKNNDQIFKELELIKSKFGNKQIFFADDNFLAQKEKIRPLIEKLTDLHLRWNAQCDISIGQDDKFLELLKKSGCALLFIGLESISEDNLKYIDKNNWKYQQLKNYSKYIQNIQSHGIGVMGAFMVGLDSDDLSVFDRLSDFIINSHLYHSSITILTPVYGTRLRDRLLKENRLLPANWDNYTGYNVNFIPQKMSTQELEEGLTALYKKVYNEKVFLGTMEYFKKIQKDLLLKGN